MEASTTIKQMLAGNRIFVPSYQRAYSWETELEKANSPKQTNVFLSETRKILKEIADIYIKMTIKWINQAIRERTFKISKKLEINFKTDILKITKAGKGGIKNESES